ADRALAILGMERTVHTEHGRIGGGVDFPETDAGRDALVATLAADFAVSRERAAHAVSHYGTGAAAVLAFCRDADDAALPGTAYTEAELRFLVRRENARTHADLLQRRTSLAITGCLSSAVVTRTTAILAGELGWTPGH